MRVPLSILFLVAFGSLDAQIGVTATVRDPERRQKAVVIAGKVLDVKGEPIKEALVKIDQQQAGTDEHGQFFITVSKLPTEILVIHFVHDPYESLIVKPEKYADTLEYVVTISEKHQDLDEVTVNASHISLAHTSQGKLHLLPLPPLRRFQYQLHLPATDRLMLYQKYVEKPN